MQQFSNHTHARHTSNEHVKILKIENLDGAEYVKLINLGSTAQSMTGWALASIHSKEIYYFPRHLKLESKQEFVIASGPNVKLTSNNMLKWTDKLVWNDAGDLAVLFDAEGFEIARYGYPDPFATGRNAVYQKRLIKTGFEWENTHKIVDVIPKV
jgi:hypothetical protein